MAAYIAKIDAYLRTPGPINDYCTLIEEKTKVQRKYIGLGKLGFDEFFSLQFFVEKS